jgi:hypothetical protein
MSDHEITLSEALDDLRRELTLAMKAGAGAEIRFQPGPIEVELALKFTKEANVGIKAKVLTLFDVSAGGKLGGENAHRIKLSLQPVNASGGPTLLAGTE